MCIINQWSDVTPFAGKIVSVETDIYYFRGGKYMTTQYGIISHMVSHWMTDETGYNIRLLKRKTDVSANRALLNSMLSQGQMWMSLANTSQLNTLIDLLNNDVWAFEYYDRKYANQLIERQLVN